MVLGLCISSVLLLTGCQWKGGPGASTTPSDGQGTMATGDSTGAWQPQPVVMRVFPGGGLRQQNGQWQLEVRLELLDAMGDAVKASGEYRFELLSRFRLGEAAGGDRLAEWEVAVLSLEQHRKRYDPITRTYEFTLNLEAVPPVDEPMLMTVIFAPVQGNRLSGRAKVGQRGLTTVE